MSLFTAVKKFQLGRWLKSLLFGKKKPSPPTPGSEPLRTIAFVVFNKQSQPVANADVVLDFFDNDFTGRTDKDGYVAFTQVPESLTKSQCWVRADGYLEFSAPLDVPVGNRDFVVGPAASVARPEQTFIGSLVPKITFPVARKGVVRAEGRSFVDDGGAFYPLGHTFFWALRGWKFERERVKANIDWLALQQFDYVRILCEVGWPGNEIDPRWPDFKVLLGELIDYIYTRGMRVELTLFGGRLPVDQMQVARDVVDVVNAGRNHKVIHFEVANESYNNLPDLDLVKRIGRFIKDNTPNLVATSASPDGNSPEILKDVADVPSSANMATFHVNRKVDTPDWHWRVVRQAWDFRDIPFPLSHNEPIGPMSSVNECSHPQHLAMLRAVGILCGFGAFVLHNSSGIFGVLNDHPVGGRRYPNVWETPNIEAIVKAVRDVVKYLPERLSDWGKQNNHWPTHPFPVKGYWPDGDSEGVVRNYAGVQGGQFICMPIGLKNRGQFTAKQPCRITVIEPTGDVVYGPQRLSAGDVLTLTPSNSDERGLGQFILKGEFV